MIPLVVGTLLAVAALAFVLYPVFFGVSRRPRAAAPRAPQMTTRDTAITALREIEFDRATGKLSDVDYGELKARYTREAMGRFMRARLVSPGQQVIIGIGQLQGLEP